MNSHFSHTGGDIAAGGQPPIRVSFEFFPPKTEKMEAALWEAIGKLAPLSPAFVSVTYGAGGSTRERTHATVARLVRETALRPAAHLTCVAATREEVDKVIRAYAGAGVRHIVALRGDPPGGVGSAYEPHPGGYINAADLVAGIGRIGGFEISVAAYPEKHPASPTVEADIDMLKAKIDANDDFLLGGDTLVLGGQRSEVMALAKRTGLEPSIMDMEINPEQGKKTIVSTIIMIAMVALSAFNIMSLFESALVAAGAMLLFRCCTTEQAFRSIDLRVVIIFACSMAFGKAIENSGLAAMMSDGLLSVCGTNPYVVLTAICLVGTFATEFISNTACGAMFYPIAVAAATSIGVNPLTFIIALMISVSSSFATPIGSPTHMLVYVPGGYRFTDFMRIGLLMNIIILAANIFITTLLFPL